MIGNFELRVQSPAKINLFLHITGRRPDGYHTLETVFQLLDYGDELAFAARDDGRIALSPSLTDVPDEQNLIVRAARMLQIKTGCVMGVDIGITKKLPMGGGLGGGSSNAAITLLALNLLWGLGCSVEKLAQWGLTLGADVPVFVRGSTAYATGIGEELTAIELAPRWFAVLTPNVSVPTAKIFSDPALTRDTHPCTIRALADRAWFDQTRNDCEPLVRKHYPEVNTLIERMQNFAPTRMTGTGSSVFAMVSNEDDGLALLNACQDIAQGFVARGINHLPVISL